MVVLTLLWAQRPDACGMLQALLQFDAAARAPAFMPLPEAALLALQLYATRPSSPPPSPPPYWILPRRPMPCASASASPLSTPHAACTGTSAACAPTAASALNWPSAPLPHTSRATRARADELHADERQHSNVYCESSSLVRNLAALPGPPLRRLDVLLRAHSLRRRSIHPSSRSIGGSSSDLHRLQ